MPDSAAEHAPSLAPQGGPRSEPYRVLARTHRPQRLSELIGQAALVRTLTNALRTGRIAHAFLLTGLAFSREPADREIDAALTFLADQRANFEKKQPAAGKADPAQAALASFCQALLSANAFLYVD